MALSMWSRWRQTLAGAFFLSVFVASFGSSPPASAQGYLTGTGSYPPLTSGAYAYFPTYGAFGPGQSSFPAVGGTFVDPVFGSTIRRLTNELPQYSLAETYAKNGFTNADNTLMYHRSQSGRTIINTTSGQVVRSNVPGNFDSSFAPDDADVWYWFNWGGITLNKYRVSTGSSTTVKSFSEALGQLGGSVDWIDASGQFMVLVLGSSIRVYDVKSDILYSGSIPSSYAASGGWAAISPDGSYVVTATDPAAFRSFKIDHASRSVSTSPVLFWTLCGDHADLVSASNGKTYLVAFECYSEAAIYAVDVTIPQSGSDPAKQRADNKRIIKLASWTDTAGHFSGVSKGAMRDWFFFDIESGDDTFSAAVTGAWRPYMQEIVMANVLTGEVRRIAHHRSRSPGANYFYTPRVSASWDGTLVAWVSNFGYSADGYADLYAIRNPGGGSSGSSGSSGSTALSASFTAPAASATVSGTTTISVAAGGGTGAGYTYALTIDNVGVSSSGSSYSWNTATTPNGAHTLGVAVRDSAGTTATASRSVLVQNSGATAFVKVNGTWYLYGSPVSTDLANGIINDSATAAGYGVPWPVPGYPPATGSGGSSTTPSGGTSVLKKIGGDWFLNGAGISTDLASAIIGDQATAAGYGVPWPVATASAATPATSTGTGSLVKKNGDYYLNGNQISTSLGNAIMTDPATAAGYGVAWPVTTASAAASATSTGGSGSLVKKNGDYYLNGNQISTSLGNAIMTDPATAAGYGVAWPVTTASASTPAASSGGAGGLVKKNGDYYLNGTQISSSLANEIMSDPGLAAGYGLAWPVPVSGG